MLKTVFNKRNVIILCILCMFLTIPTAFAQDVSDVDNCLSPSDTDLNIADDVSSVSYDLGDLKTTYGSDSDSEDSNGIAQNTLDNNIVGSKDDTILDANSNSNPINSVDVLLDDVDSKSGDLEDFDLNDLDSIDNNIGAFSANFDQKPNLGDNAGVIIYVSPKGNDIAGSGSLKNPFATVTKAESIANDGDTICLLNGTYSFNDFYINKNLTILGESQANTILDGAGTNRICSVNATDVSFINLTFQNGYACKSNEENGGAISSKVAGHLNLINCTFLNNRGDTHGGAVCVFQNYRTPSDKTGNMYLFVKGCTFINNTAVKMYGGAIHMSDTSYNGDVYANISSSIFIDNTGGREQEHSIAVSGSNSTYLDIHDCVIFADAEKIISSEGAYKALVYYRQHSTRGIGYANVDGNWWGDNENPADFNRTSNIEVNNWIIMEASVSKSYVVVTLDTLKTTENKLLDYDSSNLPNRIAVYSPSSFFNDDDADLIGGVAKNLFIGETPNDVSVTVDNQELNLTVNTLYDNFWFIGDQGYQTLKDAVLAAQSGDVIKGVADIYTPDEFDSEIIIDKNLTITTLTDDENDYVLLSSEVSRIFNVQSGVNLNLSHIIFDNGVGDGAYDGGLIYVNSGASLEIDNSIFRKSSKVSKGGAIYSEGNLAIRNSQFADIESSDNGGAIYIKNADLIIENTSFDSISSNSVGGVIYVESGDSLSINSSNFTNNNANNAGAIYSNADSNTIYKSIFRDNSAVNDYDIMYVNENVLIENCILVEAAVNDIVDVYVNDQENASLNKNYWGTNSKADNKRTNVDIDNWVILTLSLDEKLNLISVNTLHNLTIEFNNYTDGNENFTLDSQLPDFSFDLEVIVGELTPSTVEFSGNGNSVMVVYRAPSQLSDEVISISKYSDQNLSFYVRTPVIYYWYIEDVGYESLQEAVDAANDGDTIIGIRFNFVYDYTVNIYKNLTIKSNSSLARAVFNGQYLTGSSILNIAKDVKVTIEDISFANAPSTEFGGAIVNNGELTVVNAAFNKNYASNGGSIFNNGSLNIIESNFTYGNAENGGAIYNNGTLVIVDSSFINNTASNGGAIYNYGDLTVERSNFTENSASALGGAIASIKSADIRNSILLSNKANVGGAIYSMDAENYDDNLIVKYSVFDGNNASIGKTVAGVNLFLDNNFWGSMNYENLIYNLSSELNVEPETDFKYVITGPSEIGFGQTVQYIIELQSITGDVSLLADYEVNLSTLLNNRVNPEKININQGKVFLTYTANQEIGKDSIQLSDLSGLVGEFNLSVSSLNTHFEIEDLKMYYNNGSILNIYLKDENDNILVGKDIFVEFDGESYVKTTDSQGKIQIEIGDREVGIYTGNVSFQGESHYFASNHSFNVEVLRIPTNIVSDDIISYYNNGSSLIINLFDVDGKPLFNKQLDISIQNGSASEESYSVDYTMYTNGAGQVIIPLSQAPGNYIADIVYNGDSYYDNSSHVVNIEIDKMPTIIDASDLVIYYNCSENLEIALRDIDGNLISGEMLTVNIIDSEGTVISTDRLTTVDGKVNKDIKLDIANYTVLINYAGSSYHLGNEKLISVDVIRMPTNVNIDTIILHAHEEKDLVAYLTDSNNRFVSNKSIVISIVGLDNDYVKSYDLVTDAEGRVSQLISLNNGSYNLTAKFLGDESYGASEISILANVLATNNAYFEAEDLILNNSDGVIVAYLKSPDGTPLSGEIVNFEINGKYFVNITDAEGKAMLNVNKTVGNTSVIISFEGNEQYGQGTKTISIIVYDNSSSDSNITHERINTQFVYSDMVTTAIDTDTDGRIGKYFYVTLKDINGKVLANKKVDIGFNGKVYHRVTDSNGKVRLQINLKNANVYTFAISFLSDDDYYGVFEVAKITVVLQKPKLTTASKTYAASTKTKKLSATFKTAKGNPIKNKKITFTVNGKTYSAKTNSKGVATVTVSISKKGTYSFTAKYAGDSTYAAVTKKATLKIK